MAIEWLKKFSKKTTSTKPGRSQSSISHPGVSQPTMDWRTSLGKNDLTHTEFCLLCADAIRDIFKDAIIEQGDSMEELRVLRDSGEPLTIFLSNLWNRTRNLPEGRVEEIERFLGAMVRSATARPAPNRSAIVPMIKDVRYLNEILGNVTGDKLTVTEHLAADLWVVYAFDTPEAMLTMQYKHLRELDLKTQELRPLAVENLKRILPSVMQHGEGPVFMLTGGDYVASLLLFDAMWTEIQETVEGDIVAAVPSRDILFYTDSTSKEGIEELRASITRVIKSGGYLVSSTMFRRTPDGWKPFS